MRGSPNQLTVSIARPCDEIIKGSLYNRLPKQGPHARADGSGMVWFDAAIEQEERVRADGVKRPQNRPQITRILRGHQRNSAPDGFQFVQPSVPPPDQRKDTLRIFLVRQGFHDLCGNGLEPEVEAVCFRKEVFGKGTGQQPGRVENGVHIPFRLDRLTHMMNPLHEKQACLEARFPLAQRARLLHQWIRQTGNGFHALILSENRRSRTAYAIRQSLCRSCSVVYNYPMKAIHLLAAGLVIFLSACQPTAPQLLTIIDGDHVQSIESAERVPLLILTRAGVGIAPNDRILFNGISVPPDQSLPNAASITLQIRRAVSLTLATLQGRQIIETSANTVGEALDEAGIQLYASDFLDPPANTAITGPLTVNYIPSRELSIYVNGQFIPTRSAAGTVGGVLAEAGIPLIGLDYSSPSGNEAPPADGQIRVVRVREFVKFELNPIPFTTETVQTDELELGEEKIIQPGLNGLAIARTRIRYEDEQEVGRVTESESVVRPPQAKVVSAGTKLVSHTLDGYQYWYSIQMYATSYSPCRSGISGCSYGTASGLPAQYGVVAMSRDWFYALQGMEVYVAGYGRGVVGDVGGGFPDGRAWIDLGYNDNNYQEWSEWVTVYFLGPPPAAIPYILEPQ